VPALWNRLGASGIPVGVVGWFVTWPAEPVNGQLVSSYASIGQGTIKGTLHADLERQTHPPELIDALRPLLEREQRRGRAELASLLSGYFPPPADAAFADRIRIAGAVLGADRIFAEAARRIARRSQPRFLAVYFAAPDVMAHVFCHRNPWREESCGRALAGAYAAVDRHVGRLLEAMGPDVTAIVVSDHGFDRAIGHPGRWLHGPPGIAIVSGPGTRAGAALPAASVYDVAPTVLALFGLPIPGDMRGRPLLSAFEPGFVRGLELRFGPARTPAVDAGDPALRAIPARTDEAYVERLRALGYVE
jgi:hypothetical protein